MYFGKHKSCMKSDENVINDIPVLFYEQKTLQTKLLLDRRIFSSQIILSFLLCSSILVLFRFSCFQKFQGGCILCDSIGKFDFFFIAILR